MNLVVDDIELTCRDCGSFFTWTAGEQTFYIEKGLMNTPARCAPCRAKRHVQRLGTKYAISTEIVCAECGQTGQVPFVPRKDQPVYCHDCFERQKQEKVPAEVP